MNIMSKVFKWVSASGFVVSTFFVFNLYFVFNEKPEGAHCHQLFNLKNVELCYNLKVANFDFCPIGANLD